MSTDQSIHQETLIEFPCDFPIKVMGEAQQNFAETVAQVIRTQLPHFDERKIEMRGSRQGKYISLTCTVHVTSKAQLDDVYRALTAHPMVKVVL